MEPVQPVDFKDTDEYVDAELEWLDKQINELIALLRGALDKIGDNVELGEDCTTIPAKDYNWMDTLRERLVRRNELLRKQRINEPINPVEPTNRVTLPPNYEVGLELDEPF